MKAIKKITEVILTIIASIALLMMTAEAETIGMQAICTLGSIAVLLVSCKLIKMIDPDLFKEEVDTINKYGGALKAAVGIPEEELRQAAKSAVCKINIDSDSRLAMTAAIREVFATKPAEFDPRKYLGPARDNMKKLYIHKIKEVLGSDGKAE